jgi:hypothetical protein
MEHYYASRVSEQQELIASLAQSVEELRHTNVQNSSPGRSHRRRQSPDRGRAASGGRSKSAAPRKSAPYSGSESTVPTRASPGRGGRPASSRRSRAQNARSAHRSAPAHVDATHAEVERQSAQLVHSQAELDATWQDIESEAAVMVQKTYRGYRGRQQVAEVEDQRWKEQEEQQRQQRELQRRLRQQQQEEHAARVRRAEAQRKQAEEQRQILEQRRRVREEAAEVEQELARLEQEKIAAERQALATERQRLSEQRQKLAAAKQRSSRSPVWDASSVGAADQTLLGTEAPSHSSSSRGSPQGKAHHASPSWRRTESPAAGNLSLELAQPVDTAAGADEWPPHLSEGVPPASPVAENRMASLERQVSQIKELVLTSSRQQQELLEQQEQQQREHQRQQRSQHQRHQRQRQEEHEHQLQAHELQLQHQQYELQEQQRRREEQEAAVLLQKTYRGYRGRQSAAVHYEQLLWQQDEQDEAAIMLQAAWRGSATRREMSRMQEESPRDKAWGLFGGSGRGGPAAAEQAVSPRTQAARRNQFLQGGDSAGGSVLLRAPPVSHSSKAAASTRAEVERQSAQLVRSQAELDATWQDIESEAAVMVQKTYRGYRGRQLAADVAAMEDGHPEDIFADADIHGDGVIVGSQVRELLLRQAPMLGQPVPTDEGFVSSLMQAFGQRYRMADGSLPADTVVVGLNLDAFCAMWEHVTGRGRGRGSGGDASELSSFFSEAEDEERGGDDWQYDEHDHYQLEEDILEDEAAIMLQRTYRGYRGRQQLAARKELEATVVSGGGDEDSDLQGLIEEGAAISIQATWRGRKTAKAIDELRSMGMPDADIRWMIQQGHHGL